MISIKYQKDTNSKILMIHSFSSKIFDGDNKSINIDSIIKNGDLDIKYIKYLKDNNFDTITFDDGLYQQIPLVKLFLKYFKKVIIFPSGEFIRNDNVKPTIVENSIAHKQYHETKTYPSTFMSSTEIWDLLFENSEFGIHGWYHYNLNPNYIPQQLGTSNFRQILNILKVDAKLSADLYIQYILKQPDLFIKNGIININYCTPYNCLNEYQKIYIDFFKVYIQKILDNELIKSRINEIMIHIYSYERISFENTIEIFQGEKYAIM